MLTLYQYWIFFFRVILHWFITIRWHPYYTHVQYMETQEDHTYFISLSLQTFGFMCRYVWLCLCKL